MHDNLNNDNAIDIKKIRMNIEKILQIFRFNLHNNILQTYLDYYVHVI